ncbi:unnamed protein product, partial [Brassica oleracea]
MFNESPNLSTLIDVPLFNIPLIPLISLEILHGLCTVYREGEAIYPLLKDVALSLDMPGGSNAMKQMFTFALRS